MYLFRNYYEYVECLLEIQVEITVVMFFLHFTSAYASWFSMHFFEFMEARSLVTESKWI